MKKILVPIDGSICADRAIDQAKEMALQNDSQIILLHVYDKRDLADDISLVSSDVSISVTGVGPGSAQPIATPRAMMDFAEQKREKIANDILESGKARCIVLGDRVKTMAMTGDPAQIIIDYAERSDVDLVIMGSCGCSGFRCRLLGRVTNKVVQGIDKAVLVTR